MNTCKDCKHWNVGHVCHAIHMSDGFNKTPTEAYIDADAADDYGLGAQLVTGPDFGCIKHSPKDSNLPT